MEFLSGVDCDAWPLRDFSESVFRFGALRARLQTDDAEFQARFHRIFHDCRETDAHEPDESVVDLVVSTSSSPNSIVAEIPAHDGSHASAVLEHLFPELGLASMDRWQEGWQLWARRGDPLHPLFAVRGNRIVIHRELPWQHLISHYFVDHVLRQQPGMAFFHGATLALGDRGLLLAGAKGAGKSTLSLALAARGHAFLSDEIAAIRIEDRVMRPFARAASIRLGPQAGAVTRFLDRNSVDREILPDGTARMRVPVSSMFPAAVARDVRLSHVFFLGLISSKPCATPFEFSLKDLSVLTPLHPTVARTSPGERTMMFLKLFSRVHCYMLTPGGTPDETADLIEAMVEEKWDTVSRNGLNPSAPIAG